ncbi:MAG: AAA-like domain-containing protein [Spirulina sp.]
MPGVSPLKTILILAANPKGTTQLRLDEEVREIEEGLRRSQKSNSFIVKARWATRPLDMQRAILDEKPQIVHFSGHGAGAKGLVLEDRTGEAQIVSGEALAQMFGLLKEQVECVLLNACHSQIQAEAIAEHIGTVIGMSQEVGDRAALNFAIGFYDALGNGRDYAFAHQWGCTAIAMEGLQESLTPVLLQKTGSPEPITPARVFISYKRDVVPDETVALELHRVLGQTHEAVIDQFMLVGVKWQEWIDAQLKQADFLIVLLSAASVKSEMVMREVQKTHKLAYQQGKPKILPVRLAYRQPFQYPLSEYLNEINWAFWGDETDTPGLIAELERAIQGEALAIASPEQKEELLEPPPPEDLPAPTPMAQPLELPEGTMNPESRFYVERPADAIALETIGRQGVTITIKGSRQMGKSSLLIRLLDAAREQQKRVVFLDFQFFDKAALEDADRFYRQFCQWLSRRLQVEDETGQWWQDNGLMGNPLACTYYLQDYLLPEVGGAIVLAMDEVEAMFASPFRTDFFGMLRGWHNSRAMEPIWKQLDLALVTSTEPYQLIEDLNQSPFNVGQILELTDFSAAQVADLDRRHGGIFGDRQCDRLMVLLHGHPYLVRRALYVVASGQMSANELFESSLEESGAFGDHLRHHLSRIYDHKTLAQGLLQVCNRQTCPDERVFFRLRGAGLVRREGRKVVPRCQLYEGYFREHLHG